MRGRGRAEVVLSPRRLFTQLDVFAEGEEGWMIVLVVQ